MSSVSGHHEERINETLWHGLPAHANCRYSGVLHGLVAQYRSTVFP